MRDIEESFQYQAWLHSQSEPEEHLFLGRSHKPKLPKDPPGWMMKQPQKVEDSWEEKERRGEDLLKREGLI